LGEGEDGGCGDAFGSNRFHFSLTFPHKGRGESEETFFCKGRWKSKNNLFHKLAMGKTGISYSARREKSGNTLFHQGTEKAGIKR
jgi:hypothetical protein